MVEEILKRKRETIDRLKQRRSIKEAISEAKKAGKRPVIAEVKRRGLKEGEEEEEAGGVCQVCEVIHKRGSLSKGEIIFCLTLLAYLKFSEEIFEQSAEGILMSEAYRKHAVRRSFIASIRFFLLYLFVARDYLSTKKTLKPPFFPAKNLNIAIQEINNIS